MKQSDFKKKFKEMEEENKRFQLKIESLQNKLKDNNEKLIEYEKEMNELEGRNKRLIIEMEEVKSFLFRKLLKNQKKQF